MLTLRFVVLGVFLAIPVFLGLVNGDIASRINGSPYPVSKLASQVWVLYIGVFHTTVFYVVSLNKGHGCCSKDFGKYTQRFGSPTDQNR